MKRVRQIKGSLTVEATLVLPLFFFVIVGFLYFFKVFQLHIEIQDSLTEIAQEASRYGYVAEYLAGSDQKETSSKTQEKKEIKEEAVHILTGLAEGSYYKMRFGQLMENSRNLKAIEGGIEGVSFFGSTFMEEDAGIQVIASYHLVIPVPFFSNFSFSVVQRVKTRGFVGASLLEKTSDSGEKGKEEEEIVYITRGGKAFHKYRTCTYLQPKVSTVTKEALGALRNKSGGKYYPCEACCDGGQVQSMYYITQYGDRYHTNRLCNKIDHTILAVKRSEVEGRKPCSKCYP